MNNPKNEITYTKAEIIRMFAQDQIALDEYLEDQAQDIGITMQALAKRIAEEEFAIGLQEGTITKVGRRYRVW